MKFKMFDKNGYCNIPEIVRYAKEQKVNYVWLVGGRGTGKTYGALKYAIDNDLYFLFVKRTQADLDKLKVPQDNPIHDLNNDGYKIAIETMGKNFYFYHGTWDSDKGCYVGEGAPIGVSACATKSSRGRSFIDVDFVVYDEFIPEQSEKRIRGEANTTLNLFETVNRNRNIQGRAEPIYLMLANSMNLANALYEELNLIDVAEYMEEKRRAYHVIKERAMMMVHLYDSPISEKKKQGSLYRMTAGTKFYDMSIGNAFSFEEKGSIKKFPLSEFRAICNVAGLTFLEHKNSPLIYVVDKIIKTKRVYLDTEIELSRFRVENPDFWSRYIFNEIYFNKYSTELKFKDIYYN